jgi:MFS family permease
LGGVLAAPIVGGWGTGVRRSRLAGFSVGAYGLALIGFSQSPSMVPAVVFIAVAGMAFLTVVSTLNTTVQLLVDERLRGRVMAIYIMGFTAAYPLGALIQGTVADRVGTPTVVTVAGSLLVVLSGGLLLSRVLERLDRPTPVREEEVLDVAAVDDATGAVAAG